MSFVRFGLERGELRDDLDIEMMVSIIDWMVERFQDALLTAELDPGLFRRQGELAEKKKRESSSFLPCCSAPSEFRLRQPFLGRRVDRIIAADLPVRVILWFQSQIPSESENACIHRANSVQLQRPRAFV